VYGARCGWERVVYYSSHADPPGPECSFRRPHWHRAIERECAAVAERVALMDLPGFARFEVQGPQAAAWLDRLVSGVVPRAGRTALSHFCAPSGRILTEMTLSHLPDGRFWLLGAASGERHDEDWLRGHLPAAGVQLRNLTERYGTLVLAGPRSRELLARVTSTDLSNEAFPWLGVRTVALVGLTTLAMRVSYVGELGFELHLPTEQLLGVYGQLLEAGRELDVAHFGLYAMESLRLEKCYRSWKADLTGDYTPLAASLERFVRLDKPADFIGKAALIREAASGPRERLVPLLVEATDADAAAGAVVFSGAQAVGLVSSGGFGYRLRRSIALAYVRAELAVPGTTLEVEVLGERRAALVGREPLYDPQNLRLRG
jgi:dimethylglycine dehydrogenase